MQDVFVKLADVPFARMFVLAGIVFLLIAVLGKIEGKIEPGKIGRTGAAVLGIVMLVLGVVLQYMEIRDLHEERAEMRDRMQKQTAIAQTAIHALADVASTQSGVPAIPRPQLRIISATYARACNAKPGNATAALAKACDGMSACDYTAEPAALDNPPAGCSKDFAAEWKCGSGAVVYSATFPPNAAGKLDTLHLECGG